MTVNFFSDAAQLKNKFTQRFDKIQLRFIDGPKTDKVFDFTTEQKITIGRMPTCTIKFEDSQLSRIQCQVYFDDVQGVWLLKDGDDDKLSTNGTWLFVDELFPIHDQMVFKAGQTLFKTNLVHQH